MADPKTATAPPANANKRAIVLIREAMEQPSTRHANLILERAIALLEKS